MPDFLDIGSAIHRNFHRPRASVQGPKSFDLWALFRDFGRHMSDGNSKGESKRSFVRRSDLRMTERERVPGAKIKGPPERTFFFCGIDCSVTAILRDSYLVAGAVGRRDGAVEEAGAGDAGGGAAIPDFWL